MDFLLGKQWHITHDHSDISVGTTTHQYNLHAMKGGCVSLETTLDRNLCVCVCCVTSVELPYVPSDTYTRCFSVPNKRQICQKMPALKGE